MSNDANAQAGAQAPWGLLLGYAKARIAADGYAVTINAGRHVLVADELEALGGHDAGPSPFAILAAALGACTSTTLKRYAQDQHWPLASLEVDLQYSRLSPWGGDRIERVLVIEGLDDEQRARLAEIAEATPVTMALKRGITIDTRLAGGKAPRARVASTAEG